ncbi:helix-turn-helix domain-containing protein [Oxalobacteraceae bacterium A2-2]
MSQLSYLHSVQTPPPHAPLEPEPLDRDLATLVAANLSRLRALRRLSLDALGRKAGVSRAMLAQIESGRSVPTIRILQRIATALQVSVPAFLRDLSTAGIQEIRAASTPRLISASGKLSIRALYPQQRQLRSDLHEVRLAAGASETLATLLPGTAKNVVLVQGQLEVTVAGQASLLGQGDALFFDADQAHNYRNPGAVEVLAYVVTHHPEA